MTIHLNWDATLANVLVYTFPLRWSWQDFLAAFEQSRAMSQTDIAEGCDVIGDFRQTGAFPTGPGMAHVFNVFRRRLYDGGLVVIVARGPLHSEITAVLAKVHPEIRRAVTVTDTIENAQRILKDHRTRRTSRAVTEPLPSSAWS